MNDNVSRICNWCNQPSVIIWMHGHGQCAVCGINVDECCRGEGAHSPTSSLAESVNSAESDNFWRGSSLTTSLREEEKDKTEDD